MKQTILTLLLAVFAIATYAQTDEACYHYYNKSITRNADGSTDETVSFALSMYTHTATNYTYGQTYIIYNPDYQTITINKAYTMQKDGKIIQLPERAVTDALPSWAAKASDFNYLKEKIIVHTGLELGCTVYLDYTIHSKAGYNKNFDFNDQFDATSPITNMVYSIHMPESAKLHYQMCSPRGTLVPESEMVEDGVRTIRYAINNIPARSKDLFQTSDITKQYRLLTTLSDFETELKELFYTGIDTDVKTWGERMVRQEPDGRKRYDYIRKYVSEEFVDVAIPLSVANGLRPMANVRKGAYATPYERAALLHQMFVACNINADVKVSFDPTLPKEFRTMNNVKQYYVAERFGEKEKLLNSSATFAAEGLPLIVGLDTEKSTPSQPRTISKEYTATVKASKLNDAGLYVLELPANTAGVAGWGMSTLPTLREVDFEIPSIITEKETYVITVDNGLAPIGNYATNISDPATGAQLTEECTLESAGKLRVTRSISLPLKTYTVAQYGAVRNIIMTWLSPNHRRLLFGKSE